MDKSTIIIIVLIGIILLLIIAFMAKTQQSTEITTNETVTETVAIDNEEKISDEEKINQLEDIMNDFTKKNERRKIFVGISSLIFGGFLLWCLYKVYAKVGANGIMVKTAFVFNLLILIIRVFPNITATFKITGLSTVVFFAFFTALVYTAIISFANYQFYKKIGVNPQGAMIPLYMTLASVIPIIGQIIILILGIAILYYYIVAGIRLASFFEKSGLFAAGIIIIPFVFIPILAFSQEETTRTLNY